MNTRKLMAKADALKKNKKNKKGFTLVELIVVLVILAILMAILIPTMSGYIKRANKTSDQSACKTAYTAVSAVITDVIGSNTSATDEQVVAGLTKSALTQYISSDEVGKITSVKVDKQALTYMCYKGSKFWVQLTVDGSGKVTYKFTDVSDTAPTSLGSGTEVTSFPS